MKWKPNIKILPILAVLGLAACTGEETNPTVQLPYYLTPDLTPTWIAPDSVEARARHRIGEFRMIDQTGATITRGSIDGRITVVDFFFTRCGGICPTLSANMARVQDSLAGSLDVQLLSFSVTPEADSVPVLREYAATWGADPARWHLMTGSKSEIYDLARTSFFADVDTTEDAFLHSESFWLLDGTGRIRGVYNGTLGADVVNLIGDVRQLSAISSM